MESGRGALGGLCALWSGVINNGIMDDGRATFSSYELRFGPGALERVTINVAPFENVALMKLRKWAESCANESNAGAGVTRLCGFTGSLLARLFKCVGREAAVSENTGLNPIVQRVAAIHLLLLEKSDRWVSDPIDVSGEAGKLLAWVETMTGPDRLQSDLAKILPEK